MEWETQLMRVYCDVYEHYQPHLWLYCNNLGVGPISGAE